MAAALKVSEAERITLLSLVFKIFAIFPIVVVFPTPFTPEIRTTLKLVLLEKKFFFSMVTLNLLYIF